MQPFTRRSFGLTVSKSFGVALATTALGCTTARGVEQPRRPLRPGGHPSGFDPWLEVIGSAFRHNVTATARLAGGTPLLAVVKNNAYGLGDQVVGPLVAACKEVAGLACTRVAEALAMRAAGVCKPILNMAETSEEEIEELATAGVWPSVWLDDAPTRLERVARRMGRPVAVHVFLDTGMNREGMPVHRAGPWYEKLSRSPSVRIAGTYTMFSLDPDFDREQLRRFVAFTEAMRQAGCEPGVRHASPSAAVLHLPEARFDWVRPGNLLFGNPPRQPELPHDLGLQVVFRLCARIARLERLNAGDSVGFYRRYVAQRPTWVAMLPTGHTDGYPAEAANKCQVLIRGRTFPVVASVDSAHTMVDIGPDPVVAVGDVATMIGPDHPAIAPQIVAQQCGMTLYSLMTKLRPCLPRRVV